MSTINGSHRVRANLERSVSEMVRGGGGRLSVEGRGEGECGGEGGEDGVPGHASPRGGAVS